MRLCYWIKQVVPARHLGGHGGRGVRTGVVSCRTDRVFVLEKTMFPYL